MSAPAGAVQADAAGHRRRSGKLSAKSQQTAVMSATEAHPALRRCRNGALVSRGYRQAEIDPAMGGCKARDRIQAPDLCAGWCDSVHLCRKGDMAGLREKHGTVSRMPKNAVPWDDMANTPVERNPLAPPPVPSASRRNRNRHARTQVSLRTLQ